MPKPSGLRALKANASSSAPAPPRKKRTAKLTSRSLDRLFRQKRRVGEAAGFAKSAQQKKLYVANREPNAMVSHVDFAMVRAGDFARIAHVEAINSHIYVPNTDSPMPYGPLDGRMGISPGADGKQGCDTCGLDVSTCPGHFGHVRLHLPVFHIGFVKELNRILKVVCKRCGHVLIPDRERKMYLRMYDKAHDKRTRAAIWQKVHDTGQKQRSCLRCGALNGVIKRYKGQIKFYHDKKTKSFAGELEAFRSEFKEAEKHNPDLSDSLQHAREDIDALSCHQLFSQIPDEDCKLLDLNPKIGRPEDMVVHSMLIPPICLRPTSKSGSSGTNEDDLTVKMSDIIHVNKWIKQHIEKGGDLGMLKENWELMQQCVAQYINSDTPGLPKDRDSKPIRALVQRLKGKQGRFRGNLSGKRVDFSSRTVISPDPNLSIEEVGVPVLCAMIMTYPERVTLHNIDKLRNAVRNGPRKHPGANRVQKKNGAPFLLQYANRDLLAKNLELGDIVERHLHNGDVVLFNRQPSLHRVSIMAHRARVMPWRTFRFNECVCNPYNADFDGDEMNLHLPQTEEARAEAGLLMAIKNNLVTPRHGSPLICAIQDFITASFVLTQKDVFFDRARFCQLVSHMCWNPKTRLNIPPPSIVKPIRLWTGKQVFSMLMRPNEGKEWPTVNLMKEARNYDSDRGAKFLDAGDGYVVIRNSEHLCGNMDKSVLGGSSSGLVNNLIRFHSVDHAASTLNRLAKLCARFLGTRGFSIGIDDVTPSSNVRKLKSGLVKKGYDECLDNIEKWKKGQLEASPGCTVTETMESCCNGVLSDIRKNSGSMCLKELDRNNNPTLIMAVCGSKGSKLNIAQMVACVGQQTVNGQRAPEGFVNRTLPHFEKRARTPEAKGFVQNSYYTGLTATEFFFHTMAGREGLVDTAVKTAETGYLQRRLVKAMEDLCVLYDSSVRSAETRVVQFSYGDDSLDPIMMVDNNNPVSFSATLSHLQAKQSLSRMRKGENKILFDGAEEVKTALKMLEAPRFQKSCSTKWINSLRKFILKVSKREGRNSQRALTEFVDTCYEAYMRAVVEPGTAVGAIAAQSIGEPGTQMTLKTFHFAGVASMNVTMGVPRIKEIINATSHISSPIITAPLLTSSHLSVARFVKGHIEKTVLGDIADYIAEIYRPDDCYLEIKLDLETIKKLQLQVDVDSVRDSIAMHKNFKKVKDNITVKMGSEDLLRVYPQTSERMGMMYSLKSLKGKLPEVPVVGVPTVRRAVVSQIETSRKDDDGIGAESGPANTAPFDGDFIDEKHKGSFRNIIVKGNVATITGKEADATWRMLGKIESDGTLVVDWSQIGNPTKLVGTWDDEKKQINWSDGSRWRGKHYHLLVEGYGLLEVMGKPGVRGLEATTNHILEMETVLGIEAARRSIVKELRKTMGAYNLNVDSRHFSLLADVMTYTGKVLGITRGGMAKMDKSVLMLASFEDTTQHLFNAAIHNQRDAVSGVSECIIMGQPIPCGTGLFKLTSDLSIARENCISAENDLVPPLIDRYIGRLRYRMI